MYVIVNVEFLTLLFSKNIKGEVLDSKNGPGGIKIKRWFSQRNKPSNTVANMKVTHPVALDRLSNKFTKLIENGKSEITDSSKSLFYSFKGSPTENFIKENLSGIPNPFTFNNVLEKISKVKKEELTKCHTDSEVITPNIDGETEMEQGAVHLN